MSKGYISIVILSAVLLIAGCGGGGTDSSGTLSLTVKAPTANSTSGTATATYATATGKNPVGLEISFSTDHPELVALDSTKQSVGTDGTAIITFRTLPVNATTTVKIVAQTGGLSQFQEITLTASPGTTPPVTPPPVSATPNSISFNKADPTNITLKGMGGAGLVETSIVSFIVKDTANNPLANQTVDFSLNTTLGGIAITPTSGVSNSSGLIQTIVSAGIIATPVRVTATVRGTNPLISVQSDQLVVSTGIPAQDSFSISLSNLNPEAFNVDGALVDVTARVADHFHNPVPDGTAIYFTTSGGSIQPSCTTVGGVCTVKWTSQAPRPSSPVGRATILAYAIGEESFTDYNGNGVADSGACTPLIIPGVGQAQQCGEFIDTPEAYRDDNINNVRDATETYIDFNGNGVYNALDGIYNGALRPASVLSTVPKTKHVFSNSQLVMSASDANITVNPASINGTTTVTVTVTDVNGNTMPSGTKIDITADVGKLSGVTSFVVPQNLGFGSSYIFGISKTATTAEAGYVTVTVTSPGGLKTYTLVPISW